MDTPTILVIAVATAVAVYIVFFSKPKHHLHPVEDKCVITFLNTKNTVLDNVNSMYIFLNDFAIHYGTKKQGISGSDPLLTQLSASISSLRNMNNVRKTDVPMLYSKIIADIQAILNLSTSSSSPNIRIMSNGKFKNSLGIYLKFVDMLTPFPLNIPILSANCARESFLY